MKVKPTDPLQTTVAMVSTLTGEETPDMECASILVQSKLSILRAVDKREPRLTLGVALSTSLPRLI